MLQGAAANLLGRIDGCGSRAHEHVCAAARKEEVPEESPTGFAHPWNAFTCIQFADCTEGGARSLLVCGSAGGLIYAAMLEHQDAKLARPPAQGAP